ncbi:MAG: hypothetical protein C0616_11755 [Desulfuromonas sp.]|nr:MAG: hypothetical protein C0616_11755 [Desulfuromonas sp.]
MDDRHMKASERFANRLNTIKGVKHFVLARNDGQLVTHNLTEPDNLSSMTTLCGIYATHIKETLGFGTFEHMVLFRANEEHVVLFPLDRYFLGIVHHSGADQPALIERITRFLQSLLLKRNSA